MTGNSWEIVGHTLRFWREESRRWWPRWLFMGDEPKGDRLVGIGWLGLLLIWRDLPRRRLGKDPVLSKALADMERHRDGLVEAEK